MGNGEGVFDGDDIVVVEHRAAGLALEDHDPMPAEQGRDLLEDVAHGGVAVAVELVFTALGDGVDLAHHAGDGVDEGGRRSGQKGEGDDRVCHAALPCTSVASAAPTRV